VPIHDVATALLVVLLVGHLWLALVNPATRASLPGMTTGRVDRAWAREGHARWVDAEERQEHRAPGRRGRYAAAAGAEEDR
jgi:cytochrome b subunit of formate dehydrogenase